jgi:hypothetical protein
MPFYQGSYYNVPRPSYTGGPAGGFVTLPNGTIVPTCNGVALIPRR